MSLSTQNDDYYESNTGIKFHLGGKLKYYGGVHNACAMSIDNFRVYDSRSLSAQEVKAIYDAKQ